MTPTRTMQHLSILPIQLIPQTQNAVNAEPTEDTTTRSLLSDIANEVKSLRQEVSDIRSIRDHSGVDAAKGGILGGGREKEG